MQQAQQVRDSVKRSDRVSVVLQLEFVAPGVMQILADSGLGVIPIDMGHGTYSIGRVL